MNRLPPVLAHLFTLTMLSTSADAQLWEAYVLRADSIFKSNPSDSATIIHTLLESEIEWYTVKTDSGEVKVFNPVGEPLWLEDPGTVVNESLIYRTLEIRKALLGNEHQHIARSLERIGMLHDRYFRLEEARITFHHALAIYEKTLGPDSPELGRTLHCLGATYRYTYKFDEAEKYLVRSLRVRENGLPPDDPKISYSLNGLAHLYWNLGRYKDAERLYKRAYDIRLRAYGPADLAALGSMSNIIRLYITQGRYSEAERMLPSGEGDLSQFDIGCAEVMNIYFRQDRIEEAVSFAKKLAERISQQTWPRNPYVGEILSQLADAYQKQGKYDEAEQCYKQSLSILEGQSTIATGRDIEFVKKSLGDLYCRLWRLDEAVQLYDDVTLQREHLYGTSHPLVADVLEARSRYHLLRKSYTLAIADAARALKIRRDHYEQGFAVMAEHEALETITFLRGSASNFFSCLLQSPNLDSVSIQNAGDAFFAVKGRVSDGMIRRRQFDVRVRDSTEASLLNTYLATKGQLSNLYLRNTSRANSVTYRQELDALTQKIRETESDLAHLNAEFNRSLVNRKVDTDRIKSALPVGSVLVEYMKYSRFDPKHQTFADHYLAVAVHNEHPIAIHDLGPAAEIDGMIANYRTHFLSIANRKRIHHIDDSRYAALARGLFAHTLHPLLKTLGDTMRTIFVAPDGPLNLVSFAALVDEAGKFLIERYVIHNITSSRDLLLEDAPRERGNGMLAFGNPNYNAPAKARIATTSSIAFHQSQETNPYATRNIRSDCSMLHDIELRPLIGTESEVIAIGDYWKKATHDESWNAFLGDAASEENLKHFAAGKRIIHLATHGYFLGGDCEQKSNDTRENATTENPLLQSGVFLAGANLHAEEADAANAEDGIVTALEVSAMDLRGTDLVVLSACETGLGKVEQGEGVYGLRRAFQMAGAKTVVSSLWSVPDDETMKFMKTLYSTKAKTYPELMQQVALQRIKAARLRGRPTHPFTWGAFVATGDWKIR